MANRTSHCADEGRIRLPNGIAPTTVQGDLRPTDAPRNSHIPEPGNGRSTPRRRVLAVACKGFVLSGHITWQRFLRPWQRGRAYLRQRQCRNRSQAGRRTRNSKVYGSRSGPREGASIYSDRSLLSGGIAVSYVGEPPPAGRTEGSEHPLLRLAGNDQALRQRTGLHLRPGRSFQSTSAWISGERFGILANLSGVPEGSVHTVIYE